VAGAKIVASFIGVVILGLLPIWWLCLQFAANGQSPDLSTLLSDGGLFFFATSLTADGLLGLLLMEGNGQRVWSDFIISALIAFFVFFPAITFYGSMFASRLAKDSAPLKGHVTVQLACATAALCYWFYAGVRSGQFSVRQTSV
jgi:hypothetical protein